MLLRYFLLASYIHACRHAHAHTSILRPSGLCQELPGWAGTRTNLDFTEARNSEWQWHQLGHIQICTSPSQITTPAPHHSVFYWPDALPATQPTASKHPVIMLKLLISLVLRQILGTHADHVLCWCHQFNLKVDVFRHVGCVCCRCFRSKTISDKDKNKMNNNPAPAQKPHLATVSLLTFHSRNIVYILTYPPFSLQDSIWAVMFVSMLITTTTTTTTILWLYGFCLGRPGWAGTRRNIYPLTPIMVINCPLSTSCIYYDPWHLPCSIHMPGCLFPQSLSKFSLVYLLAWHPPLHTPYISSSSHCLLFTTHAHTIAACFAVVSRLCHLILVSLSTLYLEFCIVVSRHTSNWPFSSLLAEVLPHFPFLWARSHFHATYYFTHNRCTISLSLSVIYPHW